MRRHSVFNTVGLLSMSCWLACSDGGDSPADTNQSDVLADVEEDAPEPIEGTQVLMDFTRAGGFYASPFPSDNRRTAEGIDLSDFPNPQNNLWVAGLLEILDDSDDSAGGFGVSTGIFFTLTGPPGALPSLHESVEPSSPIQLIGVDPAAPDYLVRYPVTVAFTDDAGPYGAANVLSILPLQGIPLRERTRYAAVITRDLGDSEGGILGLSRSMALLAAGARPDGMSEAAFSAYLDALDTLDDAGIEPADIAGMTVFTTDAPSRTLRDVRDQVLGGDLPTPLSPFSLVEVHDGLCVYHSTIEMPVFQGGAPPFSQSGGGWVFDDDGVVLQRREEAAFYVTIPQRVMPAAGFRTAVFIRTGGPGDRPLVDGGPVSTPGETPNEPGAGPALHFARAGFAGVSIDGPHGGLRNITGGDEQFLVFNVYNPLALRDNIRQSALEISLLAHILDSVTIAAGDCPGVSAPGGGSEVFFDTDSMALMGHSTGATIAVPVLAIEPRYEAAILSGAGGSYIENIVHKQSPVEVRPLAELIIGYAAAGRSLHSHDPVLTLTGWAGESADPPAYARQIISEPEASAAPRHILMLQGIVDTYILPPIANATSLSLGLDLAGAALDVDHPELSQYTPLSDLLEYVGRRAIALPASGNLDIDGSPVTAVVVQHLEDGILDGHEIAWQLEPAMHQYRCFLESFSEGLPAVPVAGDALTPCDR